MTQINQSPPIVTALDARLGRGERKLLFMDRADPAVLPDPAIAPFSDGIVSVIREIQVLIDCVLDARRPSPLRSGARSAIWRLEGDAAWGATITRLARLPTHVLRGIQGLLTETTLRYDALALVATHFPEQLNRYQPADGWAVILLDFLKRVQQAGWVPLDEGLIIALERATVSGPAGRREFTDMLEFVPLEMLVPDSYIFEDDYCGNAYWPRGLLYGLFVDPGYLVDNLAFLEQALDPQDIDPEKMAWGVQHAPPGTFKPGTPLAYLPEAVLLYRHETGFDLVDALGECGSATGIFSWADMDKLRAEWRAVKPMLARYDELEQWVTSRQNAGRLIELVLMLSRGGED